METFNIIAGICSILSLLVGLFVANKVYNINSTSNSPNNSSTLSKDVNQAGGSMYIGVQPPAPQPQQQNNNNG